MSIVSDASPLINLAAIERLSLLNQVAGNIIIPTAVYHEIVIDGAGKPGAVELPNTPWIQTCQVHDKSLVTSLRQYLDDGESEAIALALQRQEQDLLIDERRGRQIANSFGLRTIGVLGIFIQAKRLKIIDNVTELLNQLIEQAHFRLSPEVYNRVLELAGEAKD